MLRLPNMLRDCWLTEETATIFEGSPLEYICLYSPDTAQTPDSVRKEVLHHALPERLLSSKWERDFESFCGLLRNPVASVVLKKPIDGEKKYSPPVGTMK